jgi:hypothetical protein
VNFPRLRLGIGLAVLIGIATAAAGLAQTTPPGGGPSAASPQASPTGGPTRGKRAPSTGSSPSPAPSDTPEPPQFSTLDGIWEIEIQPVGKKLATYTHLNITTTGANLGGYYQPGKNKNVKYPLTGTFDGRLVSLTVTMPDGTTTTLTGYVESFGDMVGMIRTGDKDPGTAFTGEHRKKQKA